MIILKHLCFLFFLLTSYFYFLCFFEKCFTRWACNSRSFDLSLWNYRYKPSLALKQKAKRNLCLFTVELQKRRSYLVACILQMSPSHTYMLNNITNQESSWPLRFKHIKFIQNATSIILASGNTRTKKRWFAFLRKVIFFF